VERWNIGKITLRLPVKEFPPFRLDPESQCLWRDGHTVGLTPKAFSMLQYMVDRAGQLVTQKDLLTVYGTKPSYSRGC
jgi:DNA-binding winged helix-turn-helix (wHTH) protein